MNESRERSPLHSECATASAAERPLAGTQSMIALASSRILERGASVLEGFATTRPGAHFTLSDPFRPQAEASDDNSSQGHVLLGNDTYVNPKSGYTTRKKLRN